MVSGVVDSLKLLLEVAEVRLYELEDYYGPSREQSQAEAKRLKDAIAKVKEYGLDGHNEPRHNGSS